MKTTTVPMTQRQSRAFNKGRKPSFSRLEMWMGTSLLLGVIAAGGYYFPQSDYFKVQRVLFENVHMLDEETILRASKIKANDNVLFLDTEEVKRNVEKLPYVKRCDVNRMYPNELLLRIVEREVAATVMVNNHMFEIDREFEVLRELSPFAIPEGPLITNLPSPPVLQPGGRIDLPEAKAALELYEEFSKLPFAPELTLSEISAARTDDLRMYFEELPYEIRWGRSEFKTQADRLAILWDEMRGVIPCEYYLDLRFDGDLVCR